MSLSHSYREWFGTLINRTCALIGDALLDPLSLSLDALPLSLPLSLL